MSAIVSARNAVLQKRWEKHGDVKPRFLFRLDSYSKEVGNEGDLSVDVSFLHLFL